MRSALIIFFLSFSLLNASQLDIANENLQKSKNAYVEQVEIFNAKKAKALAEYADLQAQLKLAYEAYKEVENSAIPLESLEDNLAFLESNLASLEAQSKSINGEIFDIAKGNLNEEKLFAFPQKYIPKEQMKEQVEAFFAGKTHLLPVDLSEGKIFKAKPKTFLEKLSLGGIWIYPISLFAIVSAFVALLKLIEILKIKTISKRDLDEFCSLMKICDYKKAKLLSARFSKPYATMIDELFQESKFSKNLLEEVSYENMLKLGDSLHKGLGFISLTASISPLLGLLGTVTGIIATFSDLAVYGNANPNLLSSGISEALITTEYGLSLAIPAFILYAYLSKRAKRILSDMEKLASVFISSTKA